MLPSERSRDRARILLVDDDDQLRGVVRRVLERAGYGVREASDGDAGLALYHEHGADLVIADIFMPKADGIELIRRLHHEAPGAKIIAMSGGGELGQRGLLEGTTILGATRTIEKPFELRTLLATVRQVLGEPPAS